MYGALSVGNLRNSKTSNSFFRAEEGRGFSGVNNLTKLSLMVSPSRDLASSSQKVYCPQ